MEGKEVRFGIVASALFAVITTAASCGAVNAMHDSFMPLGGMIPLINMELGEIIVGGVGAGLYGMLLFVIVAMFVAGLMVGRTPEYVGKKIEAREVKMTMLAILSCRWPCWASPPWRRGAGGPRRPAQHRPARLQRDALRLHLGRRQQWQRLRRPHRQHALLQQHACGIAMLLGRFGMIVPMLAVAGSLAAKRKAAASRRHLADPRRAVRRPAGRRHPDRGRPDLLPGAGPRPDRRALGDARRHPVLRGVSHEPRARQVAVAARPGDPDARRARELPQARPARAGRRTRSCSSSRW